MKESTGERIKRLRLEKKMSVTEFAEKVGTSRMQIYRYESDAIEKMPYKVLIPIAKVLGTTPMYLLGNDDEQNHAERKSPQNTGRACKTSGHVADDNSPCSRIYPAVCA